MDFSDDAAMPAFPWLGQSITDLEHGKLPDPVAEAIRRVLKKQDKLEERLKILEKASGIAAAASGESGRPEEKQSAP